MKYVVTGGAGFIGSHLIDRLVASGHDVVCIDSFFSGRRENVERHLGNPRFKLVRHDVSLPYPYGKLGRVDRIVNLACPASPVQYQFDPVKTLNTSVLGTQHMLELARRTGARMLQASTSEVYGDPKVHPQREDYWGNVDPLGQRACYDEGKRAAETLCKDYHEQYGVDSRIIRIFNVYGPRMLFNDGRVISNFILNALLGQDIVVHGDGSQTRSFCYVDDFIQALLAVLEADVDYHPVNVGNPDERSIMEVANLVRKATGADVEVRAVPYDQVRGRMGDVMQRRADISRLQQLTDWQPTTSLEDGLRMTVEDFRARLSSRPRVAVFAPAYLPLEGPAERAVASTVARLPGWSFDIYTARLDRSLPAEERGEGYTIYRLGSGRPLDKYLLPLRAALAARRHHRHEPYRVAWAVMASYGGLAAALFSSLARIPMLLSVYEGNLDSAKLRRGVWLSPLYRAIFRRAHRWQVVAEMTDRQRAWLEDERNVQAVQLDAEPGELAKRTNELLQELEILGTRF